MMNLRLFLLVRDELSCVRFSQGRNIIEAERLCDSCHQRKLYCGVTDGRQGTVRESRKDVGLGSKNMFIIIN
jgi:hypothetical protein